MPYASDGSRVDARDVLDDQEYADYRRSLRDRLPSRIAVRENTEEAALAAYERLVYGE